MYVVKWQHFSSEIVNTLQFWKFDDAGNLLKAEFEHKSECERFISELNRTYPKIYHWIGMK